MTNVKTYDNGLKLIVKKADGLLSVTLGVIVKTGSKNETEKNNGISHFIEHMLFKGTNKRTSFEISDHIDRIGAQINAFTAKEITCYYTKSTLEHFEESADILADLFFNSVFDEEESKKEKGVVIEEINMCEDTPDDLCLDLLAESYFGKKGLGQTILGPAKNIERFTKQDIKEYMDEYYRPDNIVISIAGNIDFESAEKVIDKYFAPYFSLKKSEKTKEKVQEITTGNLLKYKNIEQAHIGMCMPSYELGNKFSSATSILNTVFGGGMSSRLFQKIREELGLAYSVFSYVSQYENQGIFEVYAGVNPQKRDLATESIIEEIKKIKTDGITESEFLRAKEQMKSSFIMGQESTASLMLLYGKQLLFLDKVFDFNEKISEINGVTLKDVLSTIEVNFNIDKMALATVGKKRTKLKI